MDQKQLFKLYVDVLEFRNLSLGVKKDLPNPMIIVSFSSKTTRTSVFQKKNTSVVMETLQMEKIQLSIEEFETELIEIKAMHQTTLTRPILIGAFTMSFKQVYLNLGHQLYNQ